jgi:hypothetical protein
VNQLRWALAVGLVATAAALSLFVWPQISGHRPQPEFLPGHRIDIGAGDARRAGISSSAVVVDVSRADGSEDVDAFATDDAHRLWRRDGSLIGLAGATRSVSVMTNGESPGFIAVDTKTGAPLWSVAEDADVLRPYREAVLALGCADTDGSRCTMTARVPEEGRTKWTVSLTDIRDPSTLDDTGALTATDFGAPAPDDEVPAPAIPQLLLIPTAAGTAVMETTQGSVLRTVPDSLIERLFTAGGQLLVSRAVWRDGACQLTLISQDPKSGSTRWSLDGFDLGTVSGAGCQQGNRPKVAGGVIQASWRQRPVLLSASDGRVLWIGDTAQRIVRFDGDVAIVGDKDSAQLVGITDGQVRIYSFPPSGYVDAHPHLVALERGDELRVYAGPGVLDYQWTVPEGHLLAAGDTAAVLEREGTLSLVHTLPTLEGP